MASSVQKQFTMRNGVVVIIGQLGSEGETTETFVPRCDSAILDTLNMKHVFHNILGFEYINDIGKGKTIDLNIGDWDHRFPKGESKIEKTSNCGNCVRCQINNYDFTKTDGIVLTLSTHGYEEDGEPMFQFLDGYVLPASEIFHVLSDNECETLKGKPRILILQACRKKLGGLENTTDVKVGSDDAGQGLPVVVHGGTEEIREQEGSPSRRDEVSSERVEATVVVKKSPQRTRIPPISIPEEFVVVYPTTSGHYSYIDTTCGSWLEDEIRKVVEKHDFPKQSEMNFLKMMTLVAHGVAAREAKGDFEGNKNAICVINRLSKPLILMKRDS